MIVISGFVQIDPTTTDEAWAVIAPCVEATRAEPGNISYGFYSDPSRPGHYRIAEEWNDQAAIDAHNASPHLAALMAAMGGLKIQGIELNLHTIESTTKLM